MNSLTKWWRRTFPRYRVTGYETRTLNEKTHYVFTLDNGAGDLTTLFIEVKERMCAFDVFDSTGEFLDFFQDYRGSLCLDFLREEDRAREKLEREKALAEFSRGEP